MSITECKQELDKYLTWLSGNPHALTEEQHVHLKILSKMWEDFEMSDSGLSTLYAMKEHHSYINGQSGNEDLWFSYIKAAMSLRMIGSKPRCELSL